MRATRRIDRESHDAPERARRLLQLALGALWILDGALQLQPYMLSRAFADHILEPAAAESPGWVSGPVLYFAHLVGAHPVLFDVPFGIIQLAIGAGLLLRRTVRPALIATILWALVVWLLGEGLGGVLSPAASPFTGAPGAAVLYALLALLAWPLKRPPTGAGARRAGGPRAWLPTRSAATTGLLGDWAGAAWLALWGSASWLALQGGFGSLGIAQSGVFESAREAARAPALAHWAGAVAYAQARGTGEPGFVAAIARFWASTSATDASAIALAFAVIFALAAIAIFLPAGAARLLLALSIAAAAAIWVLGESFGQILSGQGTDPNTGPLLILIALAFWPLRSLREAEASTEPGAVRAAVGALPRLRRRPFAALPCEYQRKEVVQTLVDSHCGTLEVSGR